MAESSIDRPSTAGPLPAEGFPSNPVALVRWQAEVNSVLPPAQEIEALERTIPQAGERLLRLVEREAEHRQGLEQRILTGDSFRANLGLIAGIVMAMGVSTASLTAIFHLSGQANCWNCGNWCDGFSDWCGISNEEGHLIR
jgi:hypothetical protein